MSDFCIVTFLHNVDCGRTRGISDIGDDQPVTSFTQSDFLSSFPIICRKGHLPVTSFICVILDPFTSHWYSVFGKVNITSQVSIYRLFIFLINLSIFFFFSNFFLIVKRLFRTGDLNFCFAMISDEYGYF